MVLKRKVDTKPAVANAHGAVYWKDTDLGRHIIDELAEHFTKGKDVPMDGTRFTAVAIDGMLYFNDNSTELKDVLHLIDRWILQSDLEPIIRYE